MASRRRSVSDRGGASGRSASSTQNLKLGGAAGRPGTGRTHLRNHSNANLRKQRFRRPCYDSIQVKAALARARGAHVSFSHARQCRISSNINEFSRVLRCSGTTLAPRLAKALDLERTPVQRAWAEPPSASRCARVAIAGVAGESIAGIVRRRAAPSARRAPLWRRSRRRRSTASGASPPITRCAGQTSPAGTSRPSISAKSGRGSRAPRARAPSRARSRRGC